ncbi:MAG: transposase, partial [Terriglobales bacterium]
MSWAETGAPARGDGCTGIEQPLPLRLPGQQTTPVALDPGFAACCREPEDRLAAQEKAHQVAAKLREMQLPQAAAMLEAGIDETLSYCAFPREHWRLIRTNNPQEHIMREIR